MAPNILDFAKKAELHLDPFPHLAVENLLPKEMYDELEAIFPSVETVAGLDEADVESNVVYLRNSDKSLADANLEPIWRDFVDGNTSESVFKTFLEIWGDELARRHPGLEANFGKKIEDFKIARRSGPGDSESNRRADLVIDCQFGVNSPVRQKSSARGPHVDRGAKLFSALLYFRDENEESEGGEYELYRLKGGPFPQRKMKKVPHRYVDCVKRVPYRANTLVMWLNTPEAIHAVAPRTITDYPRRYMVVSGECFGGARPSGFFSHFDDWDRPLNRLRSVLGL